MLLKNDNSNKSKYSFDFYYNFLYSGRSQGFLFFPELLLGCGLLRISLSFSYLLMSCSYFCLVFHLDIFLTLPLKFSTVFCTYMSSFITSQSFFALEYSFSCMNTACSLQWELNLLLFPSCSCSLCIFSLCACVCLVFVFAQVSIFHVGRFSQVSGDPQL